MIKAILKDQFLLAEIKQASSARDTFHLWWLGQSGFLLKWQDVHILIDPYLSDSLTKKYADTDIRHIRMTELVIDPSQLNFIDLVTSSHNHTDHLDGETLIPLIEANPGILMIVPRANQSFIANRIGQNPEWLICLSDQESVSFSMGISVYGIPAAHNLLDRDDEGNCQYMGYVFQFGEFQVYHSGDTLWHDEIIEQLKPFDIDLAILPINGNKPERRVAGNLNAMEAVQLAKKINAKILIPCHYHMFTFNTVDPDEFIQIAEKENQRNRILQCGEGFQYQK